MSKLRLFILFILMSIMHSMYGQNRCLRDSLFQILQKEHINSFSFAMYYNTRTIRHKYGYVNLKGRIKPGSIKLYLNKLQETNKKKARWVHHSFNAPVYLEDSLLRLISLLFISEKIPAIQKLEWNDTLLYEDMNCFRIKFKRKGREKTLDYYFSDYSQQQIISDKTILYSPSMIELFKLIENIIDHGVESRQTRGWFSSMLQTK